MEFENESELQKFLSDVLASMGHQNTREVSTNDGARIDILSDTMAIEVKPVLSRSSLYQAAGQLAVYKSSFPGREFILAGLAPDSETGFKSAIAAAARIEKEMGMKTWFVNQMPEFTKAYGAYSDDASPTASSSNDDYDYDSLPLGRWLFGGLAIIFIVGMFSAGPRSAPTGTSSDRTSVSAARGEATVTKPAYIRRSPVIDESNIIGQTQVGDIVTLTGKRSLNSDAEWAEIISTTGDRAWIAAPAVQP